MKAASGPSTRAMLYLGLTLVCANFAHAQTFKKVSVKGNATMKQVASGATSAWALATNGNPYIFKTNKFVPANTISLTQIAVGGGSLLQPDTVWGLDSSGNIYSAAKSGTTWTFSPIAHSGFFTAIVAGPGYQDSCHPYEVWGLNSGSEIFRYNFCGLHFEQVPGTLCDIKVGGGDIWGATCGPDAFRFDFSRGSFVQVGDSFLAFPILAVGPNGGVWALDSGISNVFQYFSYRSAFLQISAGFAFTQIQAGGNGVWLLGRDKIYRWDAITPAFVQVQSPVSLASLSVGSGAGVFGIDGTGKVYAFTTP